MYGPQRTAQLASHVGLLNFASAQNNAKQKSRLAYHLNKSSTVWASLLWGLGTNCHCAPPPPTALIVWLRSALSLHGESTYSPLAVLKPRNLLDGQKMVFTSTNPTYLLPFLSWPLILVLVVLIELVHAPGDPPDLFILKCIPKMIKWKPTFLFPGIFINVVPSSLV